MKDTWIIQREQLEEWKKALLAEPSVPGDGIDTVKGQIQDILYQMDDATNNVEEGLQFHEVEIGKVYLLRPVATTKQYLHNIPVKITDKKLKNVTGTLEKAAGKYKVGTRFTIPPSSLMRP
jgi:hypothetical protein